jgi:hypothetical protein
LRRRCAQSTPSLSFPCPRPLVPERSPTTRIEHSESNIQHSRSAIRHSSFPYGPTSPMASFRPLRATSDFRSLRTKTQRPKITPLMSPKKSMNARISPAPSPLPRGPGNKTPEFCTLNGAALRGQNPPHPAPQAGHPISAFPIPHPTSSLQYPLSPQASAHIRTARPFALFDRTKVV